MSVKMSCRVEFFMNRFRTTVYIPLCYSLIYFFFLNKVSASYIFIGHCPFSRKMSVFLTLGWVYKYAPLWFKNSTVFISLVSPILFLCDFSFFFPYSILSKVVSNLLFFSEN